MDRVYFDYNASAPLRPAARDARLACLDLTGNGSSVHGEGRRLHGLIGDARDKLASHCGVDSKSVIFTSGATEANNLVLSPTYGYFGKPLTIQRLVVGATEHPSVLAGGRFLPEQIQICPVDDNGVVDLVALKSMFTDDEAGQALVSVMLVNNETGVIQPVAEIADAIKGTKALLHVDATQGLTKLEMNLGKLGADFITLSGHKIGGGWGAGALVCGSDSIMPRPLISGGGQEFLRRAGTENAEAILGFIAALPDKGIDFQENSRIAALRDFFESSLRSISPEVTIFSATAERVGNTSCFAVPGIAAETAMISLDLHGIAVSSGSACSSGKVGPSHVLLAMNIAPELSRGAIRVSMGWDTKKSDVERLIEVWRSIIEKMGQHIRAA